MTQETVTTVVPDHSRVPSGQLGDENRPRGTRWESLHPRVRRAIIGLFLVACWQAYTSLTDISALLVPSPRAVAESLLRGWSDGTISAATGMTLRILVVGIGLGGLIAIFFTVFATWTTVGADTMEFLGSVLSPIPAIAILPLAMLWFGLTETALLVVLVNTVLWPVAFNLRLGFLTISPTILAVSKNIGLHGWRELIYILIPGALPYIISGFRTAWAFGWRTIVAAELVFGATGGEGGLGYLLNQSRYFLNTERVFAGLVTIAVIGIALESAFRVLEKATVQRWGMKGSGSKQPA